MNQDLSNPFTGHTEGDVWDFIGFYISEGANCIFAFDVRYSEKHSLYIE